MNDTTLGELFINNQFFCYTLEDKIRDVKIKHETCIPAGTYEVIMNYSDRFKRPLPLLLNVPNFVGIRIHAGNSKLDTSGCLLLGSKVKNDKLVNSKMTVESFIELLKTTLPKEKVKITIINPETPTIQPELPIEVKQETKIVQPKQSLIKQFIQWLITILLLKR